MSDAHPATEAFRGVAEQGPERLRGVVARFGARTDVTPSSFAFELRDEPGGRVERSPSDDALLPL